MRLAGGSWRITILLLCLAGTFLSAGPADAFDLTDGIRFGAFSMHPSILTSVRYIDNIYFVPNDYEPENRFSVPQDVESDFVLNIMPAILFDVTIPTFTVQAGYRFYNDQYLGYDDEYDEHSKLDASNHTYTGLIDYQAPFGLLFKAQDAYTVQQAFEESEEYADFVQGEQTHNDGRGLLGFVHGPENNLYVAYTYINILDAYEKYEEYNKMTQHHQGEFRIKFFPRTAVVAQGGYATVDYEEETVAYDAEVFWGMGGLQGQITKNLLLTLKGGYMQRDYQESEDAFGPIADASLALVFPAQTRLAIGYRRDLKEATTTNFYSSDEGYLSFTRLWFGRLTSELSGSYQYNEFSEPLDRHEDFFQGKVDLMLRLVFWLYAGTGYQIEHKIYDDGTNRDAITRNIALVKMLAQF